MKNKTTTTPTPRLPRAIENAIVLYGNAEYHCGCELGVSSEAFSVCLGRSNHYKQRLRRAIAAALAKKTGGRA